ncbi:uncharacterized skeletal organic matrix protein 5-like [Pocillopora damicornis]|uniref:uncharacterized skeletal organic matrix protein 5-like n=1 Tax=Pocillopora damicornis TaxID=46731 RepID=UPI000F554A59|nr:uncharacterized skeletal organic matrix protein 5-like [Pocillopora damicornis]
MHIEQDVVDFEMGDTDTKSGPDSIVGNGDDTDIAVDIAEELTHGSRTNETESELRNEVDNGIANDGQTTFDYDSHYWSDKNQYNTPGGRTGFDSQETKLPTYWNTPFSKICLGMKISGQLRFIVINKQANSLYSLIADGTYRATSLGRNEWKKLIGAAGSLQLNCNKEGFNTVGTSSYHSKARVGYIANDQNGCGSCDSRIGFGTGGYPNNSITCGNVAAHSPDNGNRNITAMGYILVQ